MERSEFTKIKKIPAIPGGGYGERYIVNNKNQRLTKIFKLISVWTTNVEKCEDGSCDITYELLIGHKLEDNPLIMHLLRNVEIEQ